MKIDCQVDLIQKALVDLNHFLSTMQKYRSSQVVSVYLPSGVIMTENVFIHIKHVEKRAYL